MQTIETGGTVETVTKCILINSLRCEIRILEYSFSEKSPFCLNNSKGSSKQSHFVSNLHEEFRWRQGVPEWLRKWPYFSFQPLWQELFLNLFDPGSLSISQCFFYPTAQGRIREAQEAGGLEVKMFSVLFFLIICLRHVARESQLGGQGTDHQHPYRFRFALVS